ncbi:response regulator transcription factor [Xylophilus sp. GW821-FHT01B05]
MTLPTSSSHLPAPAAPAALEPLLPGPLLIVEDDPIMQERMAAILISLGYVAEALSFAGSIVEAHGLLAEQPFAMALIDIGLPDGSGIDLIRELHLRDPALPLLVVSAWRSEQVIVTALQAGATGYLLKEREDIEIALSIRSALRGGAPIDPFVAKRILALLDPASPVRPAVPSPRLSRRELEILDLVGQGLTNRDIAESLALSRLTVECHIKNIYKKLAVTSRTQAVFEARGSGLLP